jgi:hypothetical protein
MLPLKAKTVNNMPTLILLPKGQFLNNAPSHVSAPAWKLISVAREKSKTLPPNVILPPGDYLGFCDLVKRYAIHGVLVEPYHRLS